MMNLCTTLYIILVTMMNLCTTLYTILESPVLGSWFLFSLDLGSGSLLKKAWLPPSWSRFLKFILLALASAPIPSKEAWLPGSDSWELFLGNF